MTAQEQILSSHCPGSEVACIRSLKEAEQRLEVARQQHRLLHERILSTGDLGGLRWGLGHGYRIEYNFNPFSLLQFKNLSETLGRY
jgi:hypothetical protein